MTQPTTLAELKQTEWASPARRQRTVKDEMRENLICLLENGSPLFPGIVGYEETVIPQLVNAILSRHNFILLGLRGQAKSRILRQLVTLLDEEIPILAGSEVNDDPFEPISKYGRELINERGDKTPIAWLPRELRFVEKLATPDVTIADIIGDVDPIKAARGGHLLSDELTMHFGLLPRANRAIFAINELPDLAGKIQVGLFNIMQEGDVQIKGYPVRLNLDVAFLHDVEETHLNLAGEVGQLVDREDGPIGARQQAEMHRQLVGQEVPAAGRLDGIDVADDVGDGDVRRGQFLDEPQLARQP